jgi:hypothetical protein
MRRRVRADGRVQVEVSPGKWVLKPIANIYKPTHKAILKPEPADEEEE